MTTKKTITLKFQNWSKFHPRKDYKRHHWFALSNDFPLDPKLNELSNEEKLCLVFLLCEVSKQNKHGKIELFVDHWCRLNLMTPKILMQTIEKIESVQIAYRVCTESERHITEHNITEQNRTKQNTTRSEQSPIVFPDGVGELNSLWLERGVKPTQLDAMLLAFPDPAFVVGEARKAVAWEESNPARRKKDFARFLNNWLARAWDSRRVAPSRQSDGEAREAHNAMAARAALKLMGVE